MNILSDSIASHHLRNEEGIPTPAYPGDFEEAYRATKLDNWLSRAVAIKGEHTSGDNLGINSIVPSGRHG